MLFFTRGPPANISSDNGAEFIASAVKKWLGQISVKTIYIAPGSPWENGYKANFNGSLRDELTCSPKIGPFFMRNSRLGLSPGNTRIFAMKRSRFTEQQIAFILKQSDDGTTVEEICRKAGISIQTYYRWRSRYGGLMPSEVKRLKQLEEENVRLKWLVANLSLDKEMLQDVIRRKM